MSVDSKKMDTVIKPKNEGVMSRLRKTLSTVESSGGRNGAPIISPGQAARPSAPLRFLSCPPDTELSPLSSGDEPSRWRAAIGGPLSPGGFGEQIELNLFKKDEDICHLFDPVDLDRLAWCDYCGCHIWGLKSKACHRCRYCQLTCHLYCCDLVNVACIAPAARDQTTSANNDDTTQSTDDSVQQQDDVNDDLVVVMRRGPSVRGVPTRFSFLEGGQTVEPSPSEDNAEGVVQRLAYDFTSLDTASIKRFELNVDECNTPTPTVSPDKERASGFDEVLDWPKTREQLAHRIDVFNRNDQGLFIKMIDKSSDCVGSLRVHINLIRPIKMVLTARPPSIYDVIGGEEDDSEVGMSVLGMTSFRLPRGTTKLLHISSCTTAQRVIRSLLLKFHIHDSPHKFALYEHTIEGDKEVRVRKLSDFACPLHLLLTWAAPGVQSLNETLAIKRIVLQENETGDIQWGDFSLPELNNFLIILSREEDEYRNEIEMKHGLRKNEIVRLLGEFESDDNHKAS